MLNLSKIFTDIGEVTGIVQASVQSAQAVAAASGTEAKAETVANLAAAAVQEVAAAKGTTVDVSALPGEITTLISFCGSVFGLAKKLAAPAAGSAPAVAAGPVAIPAAAAPFTPGPGLAAVTPA
jgi:hypothetical protein